MEGAVGWQNVLPTSPQKITLYIYIKKYVSLHSFKKPYGESLFVGIKICRQISINHITDLLLAKFAIGQVQ